jgi:hypothetical protein
LAQHAAAGDAAQAIGLVAIDRLVVGRNRQNVDSLWVLKFRYAPNSLDISSLRIRPHTS